MVFPQQGFKGNPFSRSIYASLTSAVNNLNELRQVVSLLSLCNFSSYFAGFSVISAFKPITISLAILKQGIYAFKRIRYFYKYYPQSSHNADSSSGRYPTEKHLQILDQLAFLLVMHGKGDTSVVLLKDMENNQMWLGAGKN